MRVSSLRLAVGEEDQREREREYITLLYYYAVRSSASDVLYHVVPVVPSACILPLGPSRESLCVWPGFQRNR